MYPCKNYVENGKKNITLINSNAHYRSEMKLVPMKKVLNSSTSLIFKKENFLLKNFALVITPTSNNSQTNVRNLVKICNQAI